MLTQRPSPETTPPPRMAGSNQITLVPVSAQRGARLDLEYATGIPVMLVSRHSPIAAIWP